MQCCPCYFFGSKLGKRIGGFCHGETKPPQYSITTNKVELHHGSKGISTKQKKDICLSKCNSNYGARTSNGYKDKLGECDSYHGAGTIASNGSDEERNSDDTVGTGLGECDSYYGAGTIAGLEKKLGECDSSNGAGTTAGSEVEEHLEV